VLTGCIGAGAALGTLLTFRWPPRRPVVTPLLLLLVQAAALAFVGVAPFLGAVAACVTIGITAGIASPMLEAAFQATVHEAYLGRCSALVNVADAALIPLALVGFGALAAHVGVAVSCAACGGAFALLLGYSIAATETRRRRTSAEPELLRARP
jgi:hypothetical protein